MTYASGGLIEALDYNNFAASVNAIWGAGAGSTGYGQAGTLSNVAIGSTVSASSWASLISRMDQIDQHQTNTTTGLTQPTAGTNITYVASLTSTITSLNNNRLSAFATSGGVTNATASNSTGWTTQAIKEVQLSWANAAAMRYYFNCGGYVTFTCDHASTILSGNSKSLDWDALLVAAGGARINNNSSQRVVGATGPLSGTPTVNNTALGYHQLTAGYQIVTRQYSTNATGGYNLNYITYEARLNAAASTNTATVLYLKATLTDASTDVANDTVSGSLVMGFNHFPPELTYIANVWGTVTPATLTNTQV